jgi:hypothetical protein
VGEGSPHPEGGEGGEHVGGLVLLGHLTY